MPRTSLALLLLLVAPATLAQQAPVSIRGRVVAAENDAALPRARVVVTLAGREVESVFTDDRGRFAVTTPIAPTFFVDATKAGYGAARLVVSSATLSATNDQMDFALTRAAAIVGQVADSAGDPAVETRVVAERLDVVPGAQRSSPIRFQADTDDRGEYRIGGLPPGRYTVSPLALLSSADAASTIALRPGDEAGPVNFVVPSSPQGRVAPATPAPEGKGGIRGRVRGPSGRPLSNAAITVFRAGASTRRGSTDEEGRFAFTGLRAGAYRVEVSKTGYVTLEYGQQGASQAGTTIDLGEETTESIELTLSRGAALSGTVVDAHGEPLEGVVVRVLQLRYAKGRTLAVRASFIDRWTDDRGRYRLFGLLPGSYLVTASADQRIASGNPQARGYAPVYYPGTTQVAEASQVRVEIGRDVAGIDLAFTETPAARVFGIALDSAGSPLVGNVFLASSPRAGAIALDPGQTMVALDGTFTLTDVPPGDYEIQAVGVRATSIIGGRVALGREPEFGTAVVSVTGSDPEPVSIKTSPGSVLIGHLTVESHGDVRAMDLSVIPYPDVDYGPMFGGATLGSTLRADGEFRITGLHGPMRLRLVGVPASWYVKSVVIDGADVTEAPFDFGFTSETHTDAQIVLSSAGAAIAGHVTSSSSTPVADYSVIVFGTDRGTWFPNSHRVRLATPRQDESFEVSGLPPGEYWIAAVDRIDGSDVAGAWQKPEALEQLSFRALRKTLFEGERLMTILRLIRR